MSKMKEMDGETKTEEVERAERGGRKPRSRRLFVAAGVAALAVVAVAMWSWFERMTATGGVITLRQTSVVPGRFPLVVRTYELSNGCARSLAFYRPDAQFPLFEFQTFTTNARAPQGDWDGTPGGAFTGRKPKPTWISPGGTASFSLELPDDRRPRRLLVPLFENAFFRKRTAAVAVSDQDAWFHPAADAIWFDLPPAKPVMSPVLSVRAGGDTLLDGIPSTVNDIREHLRKYYCQTGSEWILVEADDNATLGHLARVHNLCEEEGLVPAIATCFGPVRLPNAMSDEWRLGDALVDSGCWSGPESCNTNDPFAPVIVRLDVSEIRVNGAPCAEEDLVARLAEASDNGARALGFLWSGKEPCRSFKRVLSAYHDIGGAWPFLFW